ncbi:MAG TPA: redox-regulated ATPase YchF [Bdellovibrionales bacterium]|nr:redox-regulated ATPase YchF [Bdellovibrionales bacterium]
MALQCGIVGLPNVGKSTLFNALTAAKAEAANYPFCTIDPNVGVVTVPDERLTKIAKIFKSERTLPTTIEFVDIAGLVAGASKGEGLGNQFLGHIRQVDAIVHVVRCFENPNIVHVSGSIDPLRDIDVINTELMLADLDSAEKKYAKIGKTAQNSSDVALKTEANLLKKVVDHLQAGKPVRSLTIDAEKEGPILRDLHLLTYKPILYVCNVSEDDFAAGGNAYSKKVFDRAQEEGHRAILISSALEAEVAQLPKEEQADFLSSMNASEPGLNRLIRSAYELLGLVTFFTAGPKEARAWTVHQGDKAPQAAGRIHSDFERGFIRAETYAYDDLMKYGTEPAVKEAGKYRSEGKEYVVKDGDIMLFRFNT